MKVIILFRVLFLVIVFALSFNLKAQNDTIQRFGIIEKEIKNDINYKDPYGDVDLMVTLTESFKKQHFVKGYYTGNGTWKIRFSPCNWDKWTYNYQFSDKDKTVQSKFICLSTNNILPVEINPINSQWFKKAVNPFFVKGTIIDWELLFKNDTIQIKELVKDGYNLFYLGNDNNKLFSLFPLDYKEYEKIETIIKWMWRNDLVIVLPVNIFSENQKPANQHEWNKYISYFFSRFGAYQNIMLYMPDENGENSLSNNEKNQAASAIINNDPYLHPLGFMNDPKSKVTNKYIQFQLTSQFNKDDTKKSDKDIPLIVIVPNEILNGTNTLIPYLCQQFTLGNSCILNTKKLNFELRQQVKDLWSYFGSLPFFEMQPVDDISPNAGAIGLKKDEYLLFVEKDENVKLTLGDNFYNAQWIDPFSIGKPIDAGFVTQNMELKKPTKTDGWLLQLSHSSSGFPMGIHLSWTDKPESSFTITWTTISQNNPCLVNYRKKGSGKWLQKQGTSVKSPGTVWIQSVEVNNLESGSEYEYQVSADKNLTGVYSPVYQTSTMPSGNNASFSFNFITDTGIEGRLDNNATGAERIVNEVIIDNPDFILGGGDYAYANRDKRFKTRFDNINRWFKQYQPVLATKPFMTQYGNHELYLDESFEDWAPFFNHPKGFRNNKHYSFDIGNVHFTSFCLVDFVPDQEELAWLDNDLAKARAENKWLIVYHHEPIYAYGSSHPSKMEIANVIFPILRKYNVDLDISGHDQNYERTYPLSGSDAEKPIYKSINSNIYKYGDGTLFLKISPCGKKSEIGNIFPLFKDTQPAFMAIKDRNAHHLALFNVIEGKSIEVKIFNVPQDNSPKYLIDNFIITK